MITHAFPASAEASVESGKPHKRPSLYDRLGGYFGIAAVVNRFSDQILINPILNRNPALRAWNETEAEARLPGLKFGRTLWIAAAAGGPFVYTGLPLNDEARALALTYQPTAYAMREHRERIMAAGANGLISKPIVSVEALNCRIGKVT